MNPTGAVAGFKVEGCSGEVDPAKDRCCMQKPSFLGQSALLPYPKFLHCQLCGHQGILS